MQRRGGLWRWAICTATLAGCFARTELEPHGGETGTGGAGAGSGGSQVISQSGGAGIEPGKAGQSGRAGAGGAGPSPGSSGTGPGGPAGGSAAQGGRGGTGGACASAASCGGDIIGSWTVASACLRVSGVVDVSPLGLGCNSAAISGSRAVAGTFVASADGTYVDRTTTSGEDQIALSSECLNVSGTLVTCERVAPVFVSYYGYDSVTCATADDGACYCDAVFEQTAGLGVLSQETVAHGSFTASGHTLTLDDGLTGPRSYQYCASAGRVELVPLSTPSRTLEGTIVLAVP